MSGQKIIDGLQEAIAAERHASDVCKLDLQARIDALEAQIAAKDRLADDMATALETVRPKTHHAMCPQPEFPWSRCLCGCDQPALATYRAARVQP